MLLLVAQEKMKSLKNGRENMALVSANGEFNVKAQGKRHDV